MTQTRTTKAELADRFERATEVPMLLLAVAMLPLLALPLLVDLSESGRALVTTLDWVVWSLFTFEFFVRLALADRRWTFLRKEWPDVLIVVLPFLRPLRIVRSARALRLLRLGRLAVFLGEITRNARRLLVRHHLDLALLVTFTFVLATAGLVFAVEEGAGGPINSFADSLWWASATVTTVGYGDVYPVTPAGRAAAVVLMLTGITLFGMITANLAAFFVERSEVGDAEAAASTAQIAQLSSQIEVLLERLSAQEAAPPPPNPGAS